MAYTLEESQENNDSQSATSGPPFALASTFKATSNYNIGKAELLMYRDGTPPNITVEIQGVDGSSKPDNSAIASVSVDISTIATGALYTWVACEFSSPHALVSGTTYAIVLKLGYTDINNRYQMRYQNNSDEYADGAMYYTTNGTSWIAWGYDFAWKTYSTDAGGGIMVPHFYSRLLAGNS